MKLSLPYGYSNPTRWHLGRRSRHSHPMSSCRLRGRSGGWFVQSSKCGLVLQHCHPAADYRFRSRASCLLCTKHMDAGWQSWDGCYLYGDRWLAGTLKCDLAQQECPSSRYDHDWPGLIAASRLPCRHECLLAAKTTEREIRNTRSNAIFFGVVATFKKNLALAAVTCESSVLPSAAAWKLTTLYLCWWHCADWMANTSNMMKVCLTAVVFIMMKHGWLERQKK